MIREFLQASAARKVAAWVGASSLLVTVLGLSAMVYLLHSDLQELARRSIEQPARMLDAAFTVHGEAGGHPVAEVLANLASVRGLQRARVLDHGGRIVWSLEPEEVGQSAEAELIARMRSGRFGAQRLAGGESGPGWLHPIRARGECLACHRERGAPIPGALMGAVELESGYDPLYARLASYARLQIVMALLLIVFVTVVTWLAVRTLLVAPLRKLDAAIESAEAGNFLSRIEAHSTDEFGRLADDFNRLLAKLTEVEATKIDRDMELDRAQRELRLKAELEEKNRQIEEGNRALTARLAELQLLFDVTRALSSTLEPDQVLSVVNEMIGQTLGFQRFAVLLMDERRERLEVKYVYGPQATGIPVGSLVSPTQGQVGLAIRTGKRVLVPDLSSLQREGPADAALPEGGSFLCLPLRHKDRLLGVLNFTRPAPGAFDENEIKFLQSLAQQAAMAILNAQLYQEKLELSITDELTQLANRRQMQTRLEMEWNRARRFGTPLSLLMVDIDHFKRYNDVNGHLLGDQVLEGVARVLEHNTRKVDTVARFGGEEFVILLPGQDKDTAAAVAEKLRRTVSRSDFPRMSTQPGGHLCITLGVASFPEDADDPQVLLDLADLALYSAKRSGRNRVIRYEAGMREMEAERASEKAASKSARRRRRRRDSASQPPG